MGNQLVSIQSVPRSGSSWLGQIFRSSDQVAFRFQPLFSYAFKGRLDPHSSREEILEFFEDIHRTDDDFVLQRDAAIHVDYPAVQEPATASHVVMKEVRYNNIVRNLMEQVPEIKVIGLVRHPCAVIDSWIHAPREFDPQWSIAEEWRLGAKKNQGRPEEFFGFDKWKEVAQLFVDPENSHPEQMQVVRYADLNADPAARVRNMFEFCGLEFGSSTKEFIHQSRSKEGTDVNSIYRKVREDIAWKDRLPEHIAATIHNEIGSGALARFLV
ncbi:MAG: sulfotransferase [Flavobacteriales bacterium]|nr:sulfotransferase [Flavobacteriales bacterium]